MTGLRLCRRHNLVMKPIQITTFGRARRTANLGGAQAASFP